MYLIASHCIFLHRLIFLILRLWIKLIQFIWNNYNDVLGEVIYQIRGDERGWCYGRIACKEGIYPSNTVRLLTMNIFGVWIQIHTWNSNTNDNTVYHIDIGICLFFSYLSLFMCLMIILFHGRPSQDACSQNKDKPQIQWSLLIWIQAWGDLGMMIYINDNISATVYNLWNRASHCASLWLSSLKDYHNVVQIIIVTIYMLVFFTRTTSGQLPNNDNLWGAQIMGRLDTITWNNEWKQLFDDYVLSKIWSAAIYWYEIGSSVGYNMQKYELRVHNN